MSEVLRFILPAPPSVNAMYRTVGQRILKSKRYRSWLKSAEVYVRSRMIGDYAPYKTELPDRQHDRFSVQIDYVAHDARHRDLDNMLKPLLDLLEGSVYTNDNQVDFISVTRRPVNRGMSESRVEVFVTAL